MKVVMIVNERLPVENAVKTHILEVFNNLSKICEILLIIPHSKVQIPQNEKILMYSRHKIPIPLLHLIFLQIAQFSLLLKLCKKIRPDILYSRLSNYSFSPPIISKLYGIPLIIEINGIMKDDLDVTTQSRFIRMISKFFLKITESLNFSSAKNIVVVSPGIQRYLQMNYHYNHNNIEVIPNGVNVNLFRPIDITTARDRVGLEDGIKYICFVGNLEVWQGLESLIQAAPSILEMRPDTQFVIVGDGQSKSQLMEMTEKLQISNNFVFTGSVPYERVPWYINACDICVAPFITQRNDKVGLSPLKLFEYLSCEKPVITTNITGVNDLIAKSCAGLVVEPENIHELSLSIVKLLSDEDLAQEMGKSGRRFVMNGYTWEDTARKIDAVCHKTLEYRAGGAYG